MNDRGMGASVNYDGPIGGGISNKMMPAFIVQVNELSEKASVQVV